MASNTMRKVSLRSLAAHKLRLVLTVFSVLLGTSFVAAAVIFTSSIQSAFDGIFDNVARGVAVEVTAAEQQSPGVPVTVLHDLQADRRKLGLNKVTVDYTGPVALADSQGKAVQTGGAPSIGSAYTPPDQAIDAGGLKLVSGRAPENSSEIVLNRSAAEKAGLKVGSKTKVALGTGTKAPLDVTVVGLLDGPVASGGFVNVQFDRATAESLFSDGDYVASIGASALPGVSDTQAQTNVREFLAQKQQDPKAASPYKVRTGEQVREDQKAEVSTFLNIFRGILLAFAAIGLIVGTFIIYNTFSMIVAQRNRELALLRAIGASRQDVSRSVLLEALIVGIIGGAIGLGLGVGIAAIMKAALGGSGLPDGGLVVGIPAVLSAIFVGIVVTLLSAWIPARRASRVPPVEAMRANTVEPGAGSLRTRTTLAVVLGALGGGALILGIVLSGLPAVLFIGLAAVLIVLGVVLGAPALSQPVVGGIGRLLQAPFGTVGKLARTNAVRNPRRSAATAFALTIGLMLVVIIGTLGASFKGAVNNTVDKDLKADYVVAGNQGVPMSTALGVALKDVPDASSVVSFDVAYVKAGDSRTVATTPIGGEISDVTVVHTVAGSGELPADGMLVSENTRRDNGWGVGDVVKLQSMTGVEVPVKVAGVYEQNEVLGAWLIGNEAFDEVAPIAAQRMTGAVLVKAKPGTDLKQLRTQLEDAAKPFLTAQVQSREEFKNSISGTINSMMSVLYALLGLALVIAVLGIVNTLALSVVERKREIGMLRAVGMSRPQVRRTIYLESAYIAVFGALLGVVIGLAVGLPLARSLRHWGLNSVVVPWSLIVVTLVGAAVVGVIAALWPAFTAARTRPLEAITEA
ncbi:MAG: ABC transporter permease [Gordonia sp. (in: high G+C Gram-positive bacteria)]